MYTVSLLPGMPPGPVAGRHHHIREEAAQRWRKGAFASAMSSHFTLQVRSVDLLDGVPHGFLNFAPMSAECRQGSDLCLQRLKEALETS